LASGGISSSLSLSSALKTDVIAGAAASAMSVVFGNDQRLATFKARTQYAGRLFRVCPALVWGLGGWEGWGGAICPCYTTPIEGNETHLEACWMRYSLSRLVKHCLSLLNLY
jgi:hypothetical protein